MYLKRLVCSAAVALSALVPVCGQDVNKLLQRMPETANVLAVIDLKNLTNTSRASTEGWKQKRNLDYLSGKVPFPPGANFLIVGTEFNHAEGRKDWQVSLLEFPDKVYEDKLAKREGSDVELIDNLYVIPSRRNAYFVQFARESYAVVSPANRQKTARWISYAKTNTSNKVNPYLVDAVQQGGDAGQINIAADLHDTVNRVELIQRLQRSKVMTDANVDRTKWSDFLMGLKGLRLTIKVTNNYTAEIHLDFKDDVKPYAELLPAFISETLDASGFNLGDPAAWQTTARGKTLTLKGVVDGGDVRRIVSMVLPSLLLPEQEQQATGAAAMATTSQSYYKAVDSLLKEMRERSDRYDKQRAWNSSASWYEYTANKIDQLPVVNTDEKLLAYSSQIVDQLRLCAQSLRGVDIKGRVLDTYKREYTSGSGYGWGGYYGGYDASLGYSNEQDVKSAKAENAAKGATDRNAIWVKIGEQSNAIRNEMSKKYNIEF
jgi:hypothetical protein